MPVPTSLAAGTYTVTASYGASADFAGSTGSGQLVVATSSTGGSSAGGTSGNPGTTGDSGSSGSSGGTTPPPSGSGNGVTGAYQTPQQLLDIAAVGVAQANQIALQDQYVAALRQAATNAFISALDKLKGGSSLDGGSAGASSGSGHGRVGGPGVGSGSSTGAHSGGSGTGSTGNGSSSNPTTINLAVNQSKPGSPVMTALLLGLMVLALVAVAMVVVRRNTLHARARVVSAGDEKGAE